MNDNQLDIYDFFYNYRYTKLCIINDH